MSLGPPRMADALADESISRIKNPTVKARLLKNISIKITELIAEAAYFAPLGGQDGLSSDDNSRLLSALAKYDGIVSGLPAEARDKLGEYVPLSALRTSAERIAFIVQRSQHLGALIVALMEEFEAVEISPNAQKLTKPTSEEKPFPIILLVSAAWCVVLALAGFNDQWVYDLSKWALCAGCLYQGYRFWQSGMRHGLLPLAILAVIFNPIAPIRFEDNEWQVVDWIAAGVFVAYILNTARSVLKWPGTMLRGFFRMTSEDPVSGLCLGVFVAFSLMAGAIIGISKLSEMTPAGKIRAAEKRAKWSARIEERKNEKMKPNLTTFDSAPASRVYRETLNRDTQRIQDDFSEIYRPGPVTPDWYPGKDLGEK